MMIYNNNCEYTLNLSKQMILNQTGYFSIGVDTAEIATFLWLYYATGTFMHQSMVVKCIHKQSVFVDVAFLNQSRYGIERANRVAF